MGGFGLTGGNSYHPWGHLLTQRGLGQGSYVVPLWGILESLITNPKRNYIGAFG